MSKKPLRALAFSAACALSATGVADAAIVQTIRTNTATVNFPTNVVVLCAVGEIVTGGGFTTNAQIGSAMKSYPIVSGSQQGWSVQAGAQAVTITAYAICIKEQ